MIRWFVAKKTLATEEAPGIFSGYEDRLPAHQNAVDLIPGWNAALPPQLGIRAGKMALYDDERLRWAITSFGDLAGRRVLELGPMEASHTAMLDAAGALVDAVEGNKAAFLKCLIVKEILRLKNARFYLGDFVKWLEESETNYDLIVASGVLYHMREPLKLMTAMARRTAAIYLWTVFINDNALVPSKVELFEGIPIRLYEQPYGEAKEAGFCGGMYDRPYWMHRDDILAALKALGFAELTVAHEQADHMFGTCFSVLARRKPKSKEASALAMTAVPEGAAGA